MAIGISDLMAFGGFQSALYTSKLHTSFLSFPLWEPGDECRNACCIFLR